MGQQDEAYIVVCTKSTVKKDWPSCPVLSNRIFSFPNKPAAIWAFCHVTSSDERTSSCSKSILQTVRTRLLYLLLLLLPLFLCLYCQSFSGGDSIRTMCSWLASSDSPSFVSPSFFLSFCLRPPGKVILLFCVVKILALSGRRKRKQKNFLR